MFRSAFAATLLTLTLIATACDSKPAPSGNAGESSSAPPTNGAAAAALPADLFVASAPQDAADVNDAKPSAKVGDKVTLVGRIGGSTEPFVPNRAIFTIVDQHIPSCADGKPADHCKTPWDYCCEPRDKLTANMATVRVVGADGQPLKLGLQDVQGLKPLAKVIVVGTVAQAEKGNLLINAAGLHVAR